VNQVGLFDIDLKYSMDYDVWLRLARIADPIIADRPLAAFRMHEGSLSMSGFEDAFAEHARVARHHGAGHRVPVRVNGAMSRLIVAVYRVLALVRRVRRGRARAGSAD
jgi:hypothetical protein